MSRNQRIHSYFSKLNSLSEKIARDINIVKSTFSLDTWNTFTLSDQEKILNNHLIKSEIFMNYLMIEAHKESNSRNVFSKNGYQYGHNNNETYSYNGQDLQTYIYQNVGIKVLHDENTGDCRDEHSFPFSYRTQSQINISSVVCDTATDFPIELKKSNSLKINTEEVCNLKAYTHYNSHYKKDVNTKKNATNEFDKLGHSDVSSYNSDDKSPSLFIFAPEHSKPKDFPDENEFKDFYNEENTKLLTAEMKIPKGFDFLSNW